MTAPRNLPSNTPRPEGYGVTVRGWPALSVKVSASGLVEPSPWHTRRLKRAIMQGSGVYMLSLWPVVMGRGKYTNTAVNKEFLAGVARPDAKPFSILLQEVKGNPSLRQAIRQNLSDYNKSTDPKRFTRYKKNKKILKEKIYRSDYITKLARVRNELLFIANWGGFGNFWNTSIPHYIARKKGNIVKNFLGRYKLLRLKLVNLFYLTKLLKQADHYRAFLARIVKPKRSPARIPRPIHTRPRPPAAPLAPPVFA